MSIYLRFILAAALSAAACALPACSSGSETAPAILAPAGPPTLSIVSPKNGDCVVLTGDEQTELRITIAITNWSMRPTGYCGAYLQCGHAVAFADDVRVAEASAKVIDVPVQEGEHTIRIELRDDSDVVGVDQDGTPLQAVIQVHAASQQQGCGGDAGTDATSDQ